MYCMPFVSHGRHFIGNRHAALVVHWLRRATQRFVSGRDKYTVPAAARDAMCTHLRSIIYGHLPEIRNSVHSEHTLLRTSEHFGLS
jgi:hypothetical protein